MAEKKSKTDVMARMAAKRRQPKYMGVCGHEVRAAKIVEFPHSRGRTGWFCLTCNDVVERQL